MYWSVDVEDIDEVDADEEESESVERTGDGAQWTVFFGAGVDAMSRALSTTSRMTRRNHTHHVVALISHLLHAIHQYASIFNKNKSKGKR
jgi:hypothetical protein